MEIDATCTAPCLHSEKVAAVKSKMAPADVLLDLADLFKALGDSTRARILHALSFAELCVCDLAALLEMSSSSISHQLRVLRGQKLVKYRKEGKNVFYSLDDVHVLSLMEQGLQHVSE
jgi:ArsR family transcriptional regulator